MGGIRDARTLRTGVAMGTLLGLSLLLGGCGTTSLSSMTGGLLGSSSSTPSASGTGGATANASPASITTDDVPCPDTAVRTGAATLIVGKTTGQTEPSPLDVRYQGSVVRIDRQCNVVAGTMHIKVGVEGRIITGPAGGPGSLNVPLRVAVVHDGVNPVTIATQLAQIPVTIDQTLEPVTFTHIYPDISFPLPHPLGRMNNYKIYVGFDPIGARQQKRHAHRRRAPRRRR